MPSASGSFTFPFYLRLSVATSQLSSRSSMILSIKLVAPVLVQCSTSPPLPLTHSYAPEPRTRPPLLSTRRRLPSLLRHAVSLEVSLKASHCIYTHAHYNPSFHAVNKTTDVLLFVERSYRALDHPRGPDKTSIDTIILFMFTDTCEINGECAKRERERESTFIELLPRMEQDIFFCPSFLFLSLSRMILGGSCTSRHGCGDRQ